MTPAFVIWKLRFEGWNDEGGCWRIEGKRRTSEVQIVKAAGWSLEGGSWMLMLGLKNANWELQTAD